MRTKIKEKITSEDMRSHIRKAVKILDEDLPRNYLTETQKRLKDKGIEISDSVVHNIRHQGDKITENRLPVLNVMVEIALENRKEKLRLISNLQ